jgi:hypothetical protein
MLRLVQESYLKKLNDITDYIISNKNKKNKDIDKFRVMRSELQSNLNTIKKLNESDSELLKSYLELLNAKYKNVPHVKESDEYKKKINKIKNKIHQKYSGSGISKNKMNNLIDILFKYKDNENIKLSENDKDNIIELYSNLSGSGLFDSFKNYVTKKFNQVKTFFDPYTGYRPRAQEIIKKYGGVNVVKIYAFRKPIMSVLNKVLNLISNNKFEEGKKLSNYDELYHLGLIFVLQNNTHIMVEKNERIDMDIINQSNINNYGELFSVFPNKVITFGQILENAQKGMGNKYFEYDAFLQNNCQVYAKSLLEYSGLLTPEADSFIFQPLDKIIEKIPKSTPKIARAVTQLGAFFANIGSKITGKGTKKGGRKGETYAQAREREARIAEEMKKRNEEAKSKAYEKTGKQARSAKLNRLVKELKDKKEALSKRINPNYREEIMKTYDEDIQKIQDYDFYSISNDKLRDSLDRQYIQMWNNMNSRPKVYGTLPDNKKERYDRADKRYIRQVYERYGKPEPEFLDTVAEIMQGAISAIPVIGDIFDPINQAVQGEIAKADLPRANETVSDVDYSLLDTGAQERLAQQEQQQQRFQQEQQEADTQLSSYEQEQQQLNEQLQGMGRNGFKLHAVIVKKPVTEEEIKKIHNKFFNNKKHLMRETKTSIRMRNIPKTKFEKGSFKTKKLNSKISLIFGILK